MATSGVTNFNLTTYDIVNMAAQQIGILGIGEQFGSGTTEYNDFVKALNAICKMPIAGNDYSIGLKPWLRLQGFVFLRGITGTYTLGTDPNGTGQFASSFLSTTSTGSNAQGATTINVQATTKITQNQQPSTGSQTGSIANNMNVGFQLDNGDVYWTTVTSSTTNTIVIPSPGLPSTSNVSGNMVFAYATPATPIPLPQTIEVAQLRDSNGNDVPMEKTTDVNVWTQYCSRQAPGFTGDPILCYFEPHLVGGNGYGYAYIKTDVSGAGDTSKVIVLQYTAEIQDFVNVTDEMYFSKEWGAYLVFALARWQVGPYNTQWTQYQELQFQENAKIARKANMKTSTMYFMVGNTGYGSADNDGLRYR